MNNKAYDRLSQFEKDELQADIALSKLSATKLTAAEKRAVASAHKALDAICEPPKSFRVVLQGRVSVECPTLMSCAIALRKYLNANAIGSREWNGGVIRDAQKRHVATLSYNSRIWGLDGKEITA